MRAGWLGVVQGLLLASAFGQVAASDPASPSAPAARPAIQTQSTLVLVPALVRAGVSDGLVYGLTAKDFRLLDDGVAQAVHLEAAERQPIAMVVLLQTGGAASRQFGSFGGLTTMLETMLGECVYRVSLITFDSQPEEQWSFTGALDGLREGLAKPVAGDGGAAIYDAVNFGIDQLRTQPATARRVILLLSQRNDEGSKAKAAEVVRRLGENNVTILSETFSPEKTWLKDQFTKERQGNKPYKYGADGPTLIGTFDLGTPLLQVLNAMRTNAAETVATMSGGMTEAFDDKRSLELGMQALGNNLANRYLLSFQPASKQPGWHTIAVTVPANPSAQISARTMYWVPDESPK